MYIYLILCSEYISDILQETKLYQIAERCLSTVINDDHLAQCSGILNRNMNDNVSNLFVRISHPLMEIIFQFPNTEIKNGYLLDK